MSERQVNPDDIVLSSKYKIEVFATNLNSPINIMFTDSGDLLVADAGITDGNGKVLKYVQNKFTVVADGFTPPLTGINVFGGNIYVSHRGLITIIKKNGEREDILTGLPSFGDHHNNRVVFGNDGKMYFGQGTATNSGVVGEDNDWIKKYPFFHDYPGYRIRLSGQNFESRNLFTNLKDDITFTGAFSPFGVATHPGEKVKGIVAASGSILRANPDGSQLELVAWGLRNPFRIKFDRKQRLYATNHGMDERGSRPVANSPDEFQRIHQGAWYGWPDFTGGYPVTLAHFKPDGKQALDFLLHEHPMRPPIPVAVFPPHSAAMGFDFNYDPNFGPAGDVYIAEFGSGAPGTTGGKPLQEAGHRVTKLEIKTGKMKPFAMNRSGVGASHTGSGGFERPIDIVFGPDGDMYIADLGMSSKGEAYIPQTGVIWRVTRRG